MDTTQPSTQKKSKNVLVIRISDLLYAWFFWLTLSALRSLHMQPEIEVLTFKMAIKV